MNDAIIISYVQKSANSYTLNAQQIIYLHDLGVSSAVLEALVNHEGTTLSAPSVAESSGAADTQDVSSASNSAQSIPPVSGAAANFYDELAPYGTWVNLPTYGWCWQPTVVVVNPAWQPYCNNGYWLWTDQGWYWNSYYSWGWAPFHYGRWCRYPGYGWLWCPDNVWGPAWVCWRNYPGYCGWAPLPPGACFTAGVGWTFNGLVVGINFGFGLGPGCFTFCDYDDFCGRHPFHHFRYGHNAEHFFNHSRVDNDWTMDAHHHFFDHGVNPSRIEAATHTHLRQVAVREFPHEAGHPGHYMMPDRLTRNGNRQVIYRPGHNLAEMRNHFRRGASSAYHWNSQRAAHGFSSEHTVGNVTRIHSGGANAWRSFRPTIALNHPDRTRFNHNQHWGGVQNPRVNHFLPAQRSRRNFSDSHRFTPAWHAAPVFHPAPAWHPSQTWRSAPVWHRAAPVWHPTAPAIHSTPAFHRAPAFHAAPTFHPAPAFHRAPTFHAAPAFSHPTRAFGSAHFGAGRGHFGGGRHR